MYKSFARDNLRLVGEIGCSVEDLPGNLLRRNYCLRLRGSFIFWSSLSLICYFCIFFILFQLCIEWWLYLNMGLINWVILYLPNSCVIRNVLHLQDFRQQPQLTFPYQLTWFPLGFVAPGLQLVLLLASCRQQAMLPFQASFNQLVVWALLHLFSPLAYHLLFVQEAEFQFDCILSNCGNNFPFLWV